MILDQDAVEEDRYVGGRFQGTVWVEGGGGPEDVVGLPFAGLARGVGQGDGLLVDAAGHAVDVGGVLVGVEDLEFVAGVFGAGGGEEESAVATELAGAGDVGGDSPFEVELIVLEGAAGFDVAGVFVHRQDAVGDDPLGGGVVLGGDPFVEVFAVEEDYRVGGWGGGGGAWGHDCGDGLADFGVFGFRRRSGGRFVKGGWRRGGLLGGKESGYQNWNQN